MTSKANLFMATTKAPDPRHSIMMDRILADLDKSTRTAVINTMLDKTISTGRIQSGLKAIGVQISASGINIWRKRNGV